jgi:hypothetical protein
MFRQRRRLAELPTLNFLYLTSNLEVPVIDDLVSELKQLTLLGYDNHLWEVNRTQSGPVLLQWTRRQIASRTVEYFGHKNPYWLMKGHILPTAFGNRFI